MSDFTIDLIKEAKQSLEYAKKVLEIIQTYKPRIFPYADGQGCQIEWETPDGENYVEIDFLNNGKNHTFIILDRTDISTGEKNIIRNWKK